MLFNRVLALVIIVFSGKMFNIFCLIKIKFFIKDYLIIRKKCLLVIYFIM